MFCAECDHLDLLLFMDYRNLFVSEVEVEMVNILINTTLRKSIKFAQKPCNLNIVLN